VTPFRLPEQTCNVHPPRNSRCGRQTGKNHTVNFPTNISWQPMGIQVCQRWQQPLHTKLVNGGIVVVAGRDEGATGGAPKVRSSMVLRRSIGFRTCRCGHSSSSENSIGVTSMAACSPCSSSRRSLLSERTVPRRRPGPPPAGEAPRRRTW
jgi:hypothetical protein